MIYRIVSVSHLEGMKNVGLIPLIQNKGNQYYRNRKNDVFIFLFFYKQAPADSMEVAIK